MCQMCQLICIVGCQGVAQPGDDIYFGGWVKGPSKQTERTNGGWVQSAFGAKDEQIMSK